MRLTYLGPDGQQSRLRTWRPTLSAIGLVLRAEFRRRWRSWLVVAVLVAVVGGAVLAAAAAGRRTVSAFPSFVSRYGFDAAVYVEAPIPASTKFPPEVTSVTRVAGLDNGQPQCECTEPINPTDFGVIVVPSGARPVYKLVSGRVPDPSSTDQVLASYTLLADGLRLGSIVRVPLYARSQTNAYNNAVGALPRPRGPTIAFRVVGFEATEYEFPSGTTPDYDIFATPTFAREVLPETAFGYVYLVRLRHGAADLPLFSQQVSKLRAEASGEDEQIAAVESSIHPQAMGWWILALLAGIVGLAVLAQALMRQTLTEAEDFPILGALGVDRRQLVLLGLGRSVLVGLVGALGGMVIAFALSPLAPLGEARVAETTTGLYFDPVVLLLGSLFVLLAIVVLGACAAYLAVQRGSRVARARARYPSSIVTQLARLGAPPSTLIGVRNAIDRRSSGGTVPVASAVLGTVLAVVSLSATGVFGASLAHLVSTPKLYGDRFQLNFSNTSGFGPDSGLLARLEHDRAVTDITLGYAFFVNVNGKSVGMIAYHSARGDPLLTAVTGHLPDADGQIGLGAATMRALRVSVGSPVSVTVESPSGSRRTMRFRVTSEISFPVLAGATALGTGAATTLGAYANLACAMGPQRERCLGAPFAGPTPGGLLVSVVPGTRGQQAVSHYLSAFSNITALPIVPTSLVNFGEAVNFPAIFGLFLAIFGAATMLHLLVVSVTRRRRETGLLKALGFVRAQIAVAVASQAITITVIAIVLGIPLGVVLGAKIWSVFASNLGVVPISVVPLWLLAALTGGVLAVGTLLAVLPALAAARSQTQSLLRAE